MIFRFASLALLMIGSGVQLPFLPLWLAAKGLSVESIAAVVAGFALRANPVLVDMLEAACTLLVQWQPARVVAGEDCSGFTWTPGSLEGVEDEVHRFHAQVRLDQDGFQVIQGL